MSIAQSTKFVPPVFEELLASTTLMSVATLSPSGEPQVNPVWFIWNGSELRFAVTPDTQKLKNVRANAKIAASIFDPAKPGRYIEFRGTVSIAADTDDVFGDALARKYLNVAHLPWSKPGNGRQVLTIHPTKIIARE